MGLRIFVVDAFTSEAFRGNPAAVVLGHGYDDWMRDVAAEMKHSETAFLRRRDDGAYDLRWFTPGRVEVSLCGHATLASAHILWETEQLDDLAFHTRSGVLTASRDADGTITLDLPTAVPEPHAPLPELFDALGVEPVEFLRTDERWFLCVLDSAAAVRKATPDLNRLRALGTVDGVYLSARSDDERYDIVSRCFAPRIGIDEDPVTGSMHAVLGSYWLPRFGTDRLRAYQASARGGELTVSIAGDRARIGGRATTVLAGELHA